MDASMCSRPSEDYGAQKAPWGTQARRSCHSACYWFSAMQRKPCPPLARTPAQHERTHAPPPAALPEPDQPPVGCVLGTVTCVKGPRLEGLALGHAVLPSEGRARALRRRADQERRHGCAQQRQRGHRSSHPSCCHVPSRAPAVRRRPRSVLRRQPVAEPVPTGARARACAAGEERLCVRPSLLSRCPMKDGALKCVISGPQKRLEAKKSCKKTPLNELCSSYVDEV